VELSYVSIQFSLSKMYLNCALLSICICILFSAVQNSSPQGDMTVYLELSSRTRLLYKTGWDGSYVHCTYIRLVADNAVFIIVKLSYCSITLHWINLSVIWKKDLFQLGLNSETIELNLLSKFYLLFSLRNQNDVYIRLEIEYIVL
jgi:hypothetical protein